MPQDHVFPEDGDTNDAANFAQYETTENATDYVEEGMTFTVDYTTPSVDISNGQAYVTASSLFANKAGVTRDQGVTFLVQRTQQTGLSLTSNAMNYVYIDANVDLNDSSNSPDNPQYVINTTDSAPSDESMLIGIIDTTNNVSYELNREPDATFNRLEAKDATITGLTLEQEKSLTIPSDSSMVVGEQYTVNGSLTVDGNLTVVGNKSGKPPIIDSTTGTLTGGSSPALDTTYTASETDAQKALDVVVSPQSSSYGYSYEYNYDVSVGYDGTNVTIGVTVNWDTDPGGGNDVGVDIEIFDREQ